MEEMLINLPTLTSIIIHHAKTPSKGRKKRIRRKERESKKKKKNEKVEPFVTVRSNVRTDTEGLPIPRRSTFRFPPSPSPFSCPSPPWPNAEEEPPFRIVGGWGWGWGRERDREKDRGRERVRERERGLLLSLKRTRTNPPDGEEKGLDPFPSHVQTFETRRGSCSSLSILPVRSSGWKGWKIVRSRMDLGWFRCTGSNDGFVGEPPGYPRPGW